MEIRSGESSLVLREPAALCHYLETGELITPCVETFTNQFDQCPVRVIAAEAAWREQNANRKIIAITASGKTEFVVVEIGSKLLSVMAEEPKTPVLLGGITGKWLSPDEIGAVEVTADALFDCVYLPSI